MMSESTKVADHSGAWRAPQNLWTLKEAGGGEGKDLHEWGETVHLGLQTAHSSCCVEKKLRAGIGIGVYHSSLEEIMVAFTTEAIGEAMRIG